MKLFILLLLATSFSAAQSLTNDVCDDDNENLACCFLNMSQQLSHIISIAGNDEPGERLVVKGLVVKPGSRTPASGVLLYAYHTNERGIYPKRGNETGIHKWHGYLHSWGKTNERGEFEIRSIRPAHYPNRTAPAHIHIVVKETDGTIYYVNDIMFSDDPVVRNKNEEGVIAVKKNNRGVWEGFRTIQLR